MVTTPTRGDDQLIRPSLNNGREKMGVSQMLGHEVRLAGAVFNSHAHSSQEEMGPD